MAISDLKNSLIPYLKSLGVNTNKLSTNDISTCFDVIKSNLEKLNSSSDSVSSMSIDEILTMGIADGKIVNDLKSKSIFNKDDKSSSETYSTNPISKDETADDSTIKNALLQAEDSSEISEDISNIEGMDDTDISTDVSTDVSSTASSDTSSINTLSDTLSNTDTDTLNILTDELLQDSGISYNDKTSTFIDTLNKFLGNQKVISKADGDKDGKLSEKEIIEYLNSINQNDGDTDNLSVKDILSEIDKIEKEEASKIDKLSDLNKTDTDTKTDDSNKTSGSSGSSGGSGGGSTSGVGGSSVPSTASGDTSTLPDSSTKDISNMTLDELNTYKSTLEGDIGTAKNDVTEKENNVKGVQESADKLKTEGNKNISKAQEDLDSKENDYKSAIDKSDKLEKEEKEKLKAFITQISDAERTQSEAMTSLTDAISTQAQAQVDVNTCTTNVSTCQSTYNQASAKVASLEAAASSCSEEKKAEVNNALEAAKKEEATAKENLDKANEALTKANETLTTAGQSVTDAQTKYDNATQELNKLNQTRDDKESEINQIESKLDGDAKEAKTAFSQSKNELTKVKQQQQTQLTTVQENLKTAQEAFKTSQSALAEKTEELDKVQGAISTKEANNQYGKSYDDLKATLEAQGLSKENFDFMLEGYEKLKAEGKADSNGMLGIVDEESNAYYLIDMNNGKLVNKFAVSTGRTNVSTEIDYANQAGNKCTPGGWLKVGGTHHGNRYNSGYEASLIGSENCNSSFESRGVIGHHIDYSIGHNTWGCLGFKENRQKIYTEGVSYSQDQSHILYQGEDIFVIKKGMINQNSKYRQSSNYY